MVTAGRREQHKAATREALQSAARRLFEEHGYAETTVRDIAAEAGVTERTFFRYFPSKEDLVLVEVLDLIPRLRDGVLARPAGESPYTAVLNAVLEVGEERETGVAGILFSGLPARFLSEPSRAARPVLLELEEGLAGALSERLRARDEGDTNVVDGAKAEEGGGAGGTDGGGTGGAGDGPVGLRASVLARASVAAMRSTVFAFEELPEEEQDLDAAMVIVRHAFAALREGAN